MHTNDIKHWDCAVCTQPAGSCFYCTTVTLPTALINLKRKLQFVCVLIDSADRHRQSSFVSVAVAMKSHVCKEREWFGTKVQIQKLILNRSQGWKYTGLKLSMTEQLEHKPLRWGKGGGGFQRHTAFQLDADVLWKRHAAWFGTVPRRLSWDREPHWSRSQPSSW